MAKSIVFLTGESIGANASESLHLYRRIVSFRKSADVAVITQCRDTYPEQAGCKRVVHLDVDSTNREDVAQIVKLADIFVVVGIAPNTSLSAQLLSETRPECSIAIINKGCLELPK